MKRGTVAEEKPALLEEWDFEKNSCSPYEITCGAGKKVRWVCKTCCHRWYDYVCHRAARKLPRGCPACSGNIVSDKNRLSFTHPHLAEEWCVDKNMLLRPGDVSFGSHKKVWWRCAVCGYGWNAIIKNRTRNGNGCPVCSNQVVSDKNRLSLRSPELLLDWDYEKNFPLVPEDVSAGTAKRAFWECHKCGYGWSAVIKSRAAPDGNGCPACAGKAVTDKNRLSGLYPKLCEEWDFENNSKDPEEVSCKSTYKAGWKCSKCDYRWKSFVYGRTSTPGCPLCSRGPVSKISQTWLDSLGIPDQHAITREVVIKFDGGHYKVDGFDPKTNTVYEFLGDYWHGNPNTFPGDEINSHNGKTFGFLFDETVSKLYKMKSLGYSIVSVWEEDFRKGLCGC